MPGMSPAPTTPTDSHEEEVAKQLEIAENIEADGPIVDEAPAEPEQQLVTLQPKADAKLDFPISVSVVGVEDDLVFVGPSDTVEVEPQVAEQITYSPSVEVAE